MSFWPFRATGADSVNRKIFRAAMIVAVLSGIAKLGAAGKELVVAHAFGRSDALDAFLIAYLVPSYVLSLSVGALAAALIPTFVEVRHKQGPEAAQRLVSNVLLLSTLLLGVMAVLLAVLAPFYLPYMASNFGAGKLHLTTELLFVLLPYLVLGGVATCLTAVLNAQEKFALPALVPLTTPLLTIAFIVAIGQRWGVFAMAFAVLAGALVEVGILAYALHRTDMRSLVRWHGVDPALRQVMGQYLPMVAGTLLMGGTVIVDQSMAAMLAPGSVAALNYGNRVVAMVLALGAGSLAAAVFPYFAKMVAQGDWAACRHTMKRYSVLIPIVTVPVTLALIVWSHPLITLLFQRGAFNATDSRLVSNVQIGYAIQIPFYVGITLFVRFLSSIRRNRVLMYISAVNLALDVVLNLVLMRIWGVAGIALSTSLVQVISFVLIVSCSLWYLAHEPSRLAIAAPVGAAAE